MVMADEQYKSPAHKVIAFLKKGRDGWRDKYKQLKAKLRSMENQVWAVSKSRQMWRERAEAAEAELKSKKNASQLQATQKASAVN
jgi:predicted  nucleic acid-binding Zn-ribbon protein